MIIGEEGTGALTVQLTAAVNVAGSLSIGTVLGGFGVVNQVGGTVAIANNLDTQGAGTGSYLLDGGTLSVNGTLDSAAANFAFTGGVLTRSNAGTINYLGDLYVSQADATLKLDNNKLFAVSGNFYIGSGVTFDVTGLALPAVSLLMQTGSLPLGTDGSISDTIDPLVTTVDGLVNPAGATLISEFDGETTNYDPATQSVYWVQENAGSVTINYSIVPEPSALLSLVGGLALFAGLQRRRRA